MTNGEQTKAKAEADSSAALRNDKKVPGSQGDRRKKQGQRQKA
jgi:hypothetical protein